MVIQPQSGGDSTRQTPSDTGVPPFPNMILIPGGTFRMGSDMHYPEEAPVHRVTVDGFWMDRTPVTNRQFKEFVRASGHVTTAEKVPDAKDYPGALPHMLYAGSLVFARPEGAVGLRMDALAYSEWAGKDLATEAEWEYAARGGLDGADYAWGDEFTPGGRHMANTWQGEFPHQNLAADGYKGPARSTLSRRTATGS
jgi:sulfatase modifying factor 1